MAAAALSAVAAAKALRTSRNANQDLDADDVDSDDLIENVLHERDKEEQLDFVAPDEEQLPPDAVLTLSSWTPQNANLHDIILRKAQFVTSIGQYELTVRSGLVSVYGARLLASQTKHIIFAPTVHALPRITALTDSQISLSSIPRPLARLDRISPLLQRIWNAESKSQQSSFAYLRESTDDPLRRTLRPLELHEPQVLEAMTRPDNGRPRRILVCGPKGSGKSTLARSLVNHLVTADAYHQLHPQSATPQDFRVVSYIDLDPGQPEFTPPGLVSLIQTRVPLLGPPFTHPFPITACGMRLVKAHTIGATSPIDDPEFYISCASDLMNEYGKLHPPTALIINCPGWVVGAGLEILKTIIERSLATDVYYTSFDELKQDTDAALRRAVGNRRFECLVPAHSPGFQQRTAAQYRAMQYQAYFHSMESPHSHEAWSGVPVLTSQHNTISLSYSFQSSHIIGVQRIGEAPHEDFWKIILDMNIVALVFVKDDSYRHRLLGSMARTREEQLPYVPSPSAGSVDAAWCACIGLAIVTDIDIESHTISLKTPVANSVADLLGRTDDGPRLLLVAGNYDAPGWAYVESQLDKDAKKASRSTVVPQMQLELPEGYDESSSEDDDTAVPYVTKLKAGEATAKRWRGVKRRT